MKKSILITFLSLFTAVLAFGQMEVETPEESYNWKLFQNEKNLKIELRFEHCETIKVKNQVLTLFRFTNTSNERRTFTWASEVWRSGVCTNCNKLDNPEYFKTVTLNPGESIEGDCSSKENKSLYIFSHFVELYPGMNKQSLTGFHFVNLTSTIIQ